MALQRYPAPKSSDRSHLSLWFDRTMALIAVANLSLVLFDLSYIPWRNFYLFNVGGWQTELFGFRVQVPRLTDIYDPVKGIEPNRETVTYLQTVDRLKTEVADKGIRSPQAAATLAELRLLSEEMIDANPFALANKTGTLERIKNRMRSRLGLNSAKQSFTQFWSEEYLTKAGFFSEMTFFDEQIRRLIETNYFRQTGETGGPIDRFIFLDIWFIWLFGAEIALRVYYIHRSKNISLLEAALWRWYDFLFLLPFWQIIRIVPLVARLDQAALIDLATVKKEINENFVATFSEELTQVVIVRVFEQIEESVRQLDLRNLIVEGLGRSYIDLNNTNEIAAIIAIVWETAIADILPQIRPELEELLKHSTDTLLRRTPVYQQASQVPGMGVISQQLTEQIVMQLTDGFYRNISNLPQMDDRTTQLLERLWQRITEVLVEEIRKNQTSDKLKSLLVDLFEEIKINYIKRLSQQDWEEILARTKAIKQG